MDRLLAVSQAAYATGAAADRQDLADLRSACLSMRRTTETFLSSPAFPEPAIDTRLRSGMSSFLLASEQCLIGLDNLDAAALSRTAAALSRGTSEIAAAHDLLTQKFA